MLAMLGPLALALGGAPVARAQTNIDQGKPASELFANYCAVCHKSIRGLANGRGAPALSQFLREHYAASREQAAALAAYVIAAGGNAPASKPERAKVEEPKTQDPRTQGQGKPRPTSSASAKPEPDKPGRGRPPGRDEGGAAPEQQENAPVAAAPPASQVPSQLPSQVPSQVPTAEPASPSMRPAPELNPTTVGAAAESPSGDNAAVPRDNIPD
jgi:hypothetical protein